MANLSIKDFDEDLDHALSIAAVTTKISKRNYITAALQHAVDHGYDPNGDKMTKKGKVTA